MELSEIRKEIDAVDEEMTKLFVRRMACADQVAEAKRGTGKPVLDSTASPRYTGVTIRDVKVGPSPEWLQKKLMSIGLKPINNVVDISNFITCFLLGSLLSYLTYSS